MFSGLLIAFAALFGIPSLGLLIFLIYIIIKYEPVVSRIFDEPPMMIPLRDPAEPDGEPARFQTKDGIELAGTYWKTRTSNRAGVIVFCHEYLGDRQSASSYAGFLRDMGFDLFAFDFRNHGESGVEAAYRPRQWVTDRETTDLAAALEYLQTRPDADSHGAGLFGVSRGGSAALCSAASNQNVWGVVTDGAFPTKGTMLSYIVRWAEIYVGQKVWYPYLPLWVFQFLAWSSRFMTARRWGCSFPDVERATSRISPRPWLMIQGEKDAYIGVDIARALFAEGRDPKELWIVPDAKHNRCREVDPESYRSRVGAFFRSNGPVPPDFAAEFEPLVAKPATLGVASSTSSPTPVLADSPGLAGVAAASSSIAEGVVIGG